MAEVSLLSRILCSINFYLLLIVGWVVAWVLQTLFSIVAYPFTTKEQRQDVCGYIFRYTTYVEIVWCNPFWRLHVMNKFPETGSRKIILMMNHLSDADPFVSVKGIFPRDGTWVYKHDLKKVPFGGWALVNSGDLPVFFRHKQTSFETVKGTVAVMMDGARRRLQRGRMLCIYPEGTRSHYPEGPLNPFRLGFFRLAMEEGAVIVPYAISNTNTIWHRGSALLSPGDAYFCFGEPIEPFGFKSAEDLARHTWQVLTELRERLPDRVAQRIAATGSDALSGAPVGVMLAESRAPNPSATMPSADNGNRGATHLTNGKQTRDGATNANTKED